MLRLTKRFNATRRFYSEQHNQPIIDFLKRCQKEEETKPNVNTHKITAYKHAISSISDVQQPIRLGKDILKLPGVGSGIITKINEFLYASEALENQHPQLQQELTKARTTKMLQDIPGIGPRTAEKLVDAGCKSVDELRLPQFMPLLGRRQRAKVRYLGHLDQELTRSDAEDVLDFCRQNLGSKFEVTLVDEYRRGYCKFMDIHLMISHPNFVYIPLPADPSPFVSDHRWWALPKSAIKIAELKHSTIASEVTPVLEQRGLIADTLTTTLQSWQGIIRIPEQQGQWGSRTERLAAIEEVEGRFRPMTISYVSYKCRAASLLCLTGDTDFKIHLRSHAKQRGMLLNEYGLWKWNLSAPRCPENGGGKASDGVPESGFWSLVKTSTEEEIFEELGLDFVEPSKRNFHFVRKLRG